MKLLEIFNNILTESVSGQQITDAIRNRYLVRMYYKGDETIAAGFRHIEPVCYGISKAGNPVVRAWQVWGNSDTPDKIPGWRLFRLDRMSQYSLFTRTGKPPVQFNTQRPLYNPNGDKTMASVYINAKF